jgi:RNA polymerase sigma factor (sigma-70 family)
VSAPDDVIEEACQQAWANLVAHLTRVDAGCVFAWLVTVATNAALKQVQRAERWRSLDAVLEQGEDVPAPLGWQAHQKLEANETLAAIARLPVRQQRVLWLRGLGLDYDEVATHEECTLRTVQRQLLRARKSVRLSLAA